MPDNTIRIPTRLSTGLSIAVKISTQILKARNMIWGIGFNGVLNSPGSGVTKRLEATVSADINCNMKPAYTRICSKDPVAANAMLIAA
jgi:hypothetical protein